MSTGPDSVPPKRRGVFRRLFDVLKARTKADPDSQPDQVSGREISKSISNAFAIGGPIGALLGCGLVIATGASWFFPISGGFATAALTWLVAEIWKRRGDGETAPTPVGPGTGVSPPPV